MLLTDEQWESALDGFRSSAFRLEVQQTYLMADEIEDERLFLSGAPKPENFNADWREYVHGLVATGKRMQRAKIIRRPFTDYTRYLMAWGVPANVEAGEDYRIIDLAPGESVDLPKQDFWLFDDEVVIHLNFEPDGSLSGIEQVEQPDLEQYRRWRDLALKLGVPYRDWYAGS